MTFKLTDKDGELKCYYKGNLVPMFVFRITLKHDKNVKIFINDKPITIEEAELL